MARRSRQPRRHRRSTALAPPAPTSKPCGVFWDIENVNIPSGQSAGQFSKMIRDNVLRPKRLSDVEFVCAIGRGKVDSTTEAQIKASNVKVVFVGHEQNAADRKIIELIRKFVMNRGHGCTIVLMSGDSDFVKTLIRCKIKYKVTIYLIHCDSSRNEFLDAIADEVYLLNKDGLLRYVTKASDVAVIEITSCSDFFYSSSARDELRLMFENEGSIKNSIYFDDHDEDDLSVWVGFPSKGQAKSVARDKYNQPFHGHPLMTKYVQYPPHAVIKRLINHSTRPVREETLDTLKVLVPQSFNLQRSASIVSSLSLPFKEKATAYLVVTGFPRSIDDNKRRRHCSKVLEKRINAFTCNSAGVWLELHYPHQAKYYVDKIKDSNFDGHKLIATISKQPPSQTNTVQQPSKPVPNHNTPGRAVPLKQTVPYRPQPTQVATEYSFERVGVTTPTPRRTIGYEQPANVYNPPAWHSNVWSDRVLERKVSIPDTVHWDSPHHWHRPLPSPKKSDEACPDCCNSCCGCFLFFGLLIALSVFYFKYWRN